MCVCVGVCVWRPIDEIKQFLGLLENYYKRIIKRGAKVESKQRRCQNNKCQCPPSAFPPLTSRPRHCLSGKRFVNPTPPAGQYTCTNLHGLVTPAPFPTPGRDRQQRLPGPGLAWATIGISVTYTNTHKTRTTDKTLLCHA